MRAASPGLDSASRSSRIRYGSAGHHKKSKKIKGQMGFLQNLGYLPRSTIFSVDSSSKLCLTIGCSKK